MAMVFVSPTFDEASVNLDRVFRQQVLDYSHRFHLRIEARALSCAWFPDETNEWIARHCEN